MRKKITNFYLGMLGGRKGFVLSLLRFIMRLLSPVYSTIVKLRLVLYNSPVCKSVRLPCKVISIGNITAGGTGKTPAVIMVAKMIRAMGKRVAVLSRGYGRGVSEAGINLVSDGKNMLSSREKAGDEPCMLADNLEGIPVIVSKDRVKSGRFAVDKFNTEVIVLDDGFQQLQLKRDLDMVVIDCLSPFSNMKVIPGGLLREPLSHLRRADMFLLTRSDQSAAEEKKFIYNFLGNKAGAKPVFESIHKPSFLYRLTDKKREELSFANGRDVSLVSGIGNPRAFELTVKQLGANVVRRFIFPDHYDYTEADIQEIAAAGGTVITTEKDGIRLAGKVGENTWVLKINLEIVHRSSEWEQAVKNIL